MTTRDNIPTPNPGLILFFLLPVGLPLVAGIVALLVDGVRLLPVALGAYIVGLVLAPLLAARVNRRARQRGRVQRGLSFPQSRVPF